MSIQMCFLQKDNVHNQREHLVNGHARYTLADEYEASPELAPEAQPQIELTRTYTRLGGGKAKSDPSAADPGTGVRSNISLEASVGLLRAHGANS